jgi:hypothetical protein
MERFKKHLGMVGGVGLAGAGVLACAACCIPLVAALLPWLGVGALTLAGPYGVLAAAVGAGVLGLVALRRRRRAQCACKTACAGAAFDRQ